MFILTYLRYIGHCWSEWLEDDMGFLSFAKALIVSFPLIALIALIGGLFGWF